MTDAFASINGQRLTGLNLFVGNIGPWAAQCSIEDASELAGPVTITLGTLQLRGTVVPQQAGTFGLQRKCTVIAGANGWGRTVRPKAYHNDAGQRAREVADDVAREVGETIGTFVPAAERVGKDFVRDGGLASKILERTIGGSVAWWVDYAGVTHVGPRPAVPIDASAYEVLAFDPQTRIATLAVDDPAALVIGSMLTERLDGPQTVRDFQLRLTGSELRISAWCGGSATESGRLAGLLQDIVRRATDGLILGKYRYRVVAMAADGRVKLQAVRQAAGLPDVEPISVWPGAAGVHAELTPAAEVLVEFIEGDRTQPIVTHFAGKDGVGFVPVSLAFCGSEQAAARQGDLVQSGGSGTICILTPLTGVGAPPNNAVVAGVPHAISFSTVPAVLGMEAPLYGAISTGSPKVKV